MAGLGPSPAVLATGTAVLPGAGGGGAEDRRLQAPPGHRGGSERWRAPRQTKFKEKRSHRQQPRHKQPMPHAQKFQHAARVLIHQLAPVVPHVLVAHVLGLSDRRGELSSWGWAGHPFFHEQQAGLQNEKAGSLIHSLKHRDGRGARLGSPQGHARASLCRGLAATVSAGKTFWLNYPRCKSPKVRLRNEIKS